MLVRNIALITLLLPTLSNAIIDTDTLVVRNIKVVDHKVVDNAMVAEATDYDPKVLNEGSRSFKLEHRDVVGHSIELPVKVISNEESGGVAVEVTFVSMDANSMDAKNKREHTITLKGVQLGEEITFDYPGKSPRMFLSFAVHILRKIYLAGPEVFLPKEECDEVTRTKKKICEQYGFEGLHPFDSDVTFPDDMNDENAMRVTGYQISKANEKLMQEADCIIADMTPFRGSSCDVGTAWEMGYMRGLGKLVLGYTNAADNFYDRTSQFCGTTTGFDENGMSLEKFYLVDNLMLDGAVRHSGFRISN